jgi:hypothetical protein
MAEAGNQVIVHHTDRLHEGVADRGPDEAKAPPGEIPAHRIGFPGPDRQLGHCPEAVFDRPVADKPPEIVTEGAEFVANRNYEAGVSHRGYDLGTVPDNPRIGKKAGHFFIAVPRYLFRVKTLKGPAVTFSLPENRAPGKSRLCALQNEKFEQFPVVADRHAPFFVMVRNHQRVITGPATSHHL